MAKGENAQENHCYKSDTTLHHVRFAGEVPIAEKDLEAMSSSDDKSTSTDVSGDENNDRGNWTGKLDFLLSCLSYAVGLGNLWRFPYLCYRNGGGAFLIPYVIMLIFAGVPLFFMELSFGQFASTGVVSIWKVCPLLTGIGFGMFLVSCFIMTYYNMIIAWTLFYLFASINKELPWATCDNHWNTKACGIIDHLGLKNCSDHNGTWVNHTCFTLDDVQSPVEFQLLQNLSITEQAKDIKRATPSDEYFHNYVLDLSDGLHDMGAVRWQLALCLMLAWTIVAICLIKGIKSSGKAVYFTATFPYLVLCVLLVRGLTLPGAMDGILYYLTPEWERLGKAKVWGDAAVQIFFSLSPCWGGLITLASYNKFHNNCLRDALVVSVGNCATSIFAGFVIFAIIGYMAYELGVPVNEVAAQGAGLAFIVYPQVVTRLPASPLWAVLFFSMLITLGLGTQFATVTTIHTTLLDLYPDTLRKPKMSALVTIGICMAGFLLGLSICSRGGMYMLQLFDTYSATYSVLIIGFAECVTLAWVYGVDRFSQDIELMIGHSLHGWWRVMWKFVTPAIMVFIMLFTWIDFKPTTYGEYTFPAWAEGLGWMMSFTSVMAIPVTAVYMIWRHKQEDKTILQTVRLLLKPSADWGPALEGHKQEQKRLQQTLTLRHATDSQVPLNPNHSLHSTEDEEEEEEKIIGEKAPSIPICVVQNETKI